MNTKVFITIDTEEDNWGEYHETTGTVENIGGLSRLQDLFNQYDAIPTYLINYPVASQAQSVKTLLSLLKGGCCEIGTHCHPWNTPPITEELTATNSMMSNLSYDLLIQKMRILHNTIQKNFGINPVSFRAGRWAFNEKVAQCLEELGYKVDTSVSPFVDWSISYGANFSTSSTQPYYFDATNINQPSRQGALLQVPATIGYCQPNFKLCQKITNFINTSSLSKLRLLGILDKLQLLNFYWLSPELSSGAQMIRLSNRFIRSGHKHLNMSFHSTSLLPGKSPFVQNESELDQFLQEIEVFLQYAKDNNFQFLPLSKAPEVFPRP